MIYTLEDLKLISETYNDIFEMMGDMQAITCENKSVEKLWNATFGILEHLITEEDQDITTILNRDTEEVKSVKINIESLQNLLK